MAQIIQNLMAIRFDVGVVEEGRQGELWAALTEVFHRSRVSEEVVLMRMMEKC